MPVLVVDHFPGADGDPWNPTIWPLIRSPRDANPDPTIQANHGRMVTGSTSQCTLVAFTAPTLADTDITVSYTPDPANNNFFLEFGYRITTGITSGDPGSGYLVVIHPFGNAVRLATINAGNDRVAIAFDNFAGVNDFAERFVRVKVRGTRHQVKWWTASGGEPPGWKMDVTDTTYTAAGRSYISVINSLSAVNLVDFDDFRLEEVVPAPAGARVGVDRDLIEALYAGAAPVIAHYLGTAPIPVPPYTP
jgi:hypothetical protein